MYIQPVGVPESERVQLVGGDDVRLQQREVELRRGAHEPRRQPPATAQDPVHERYADWDRLI